MAVDQDGKFRSKRHRYLKPKQSQQTKQDAPKGNDISIFEYVSASITLRLTLSHLKWLGRGIGRSAQFLMASATGLLLGTWTLLLMVLRSAKTLLVSTLATAGAISMIIAVAVWKEPETFANILAPPFEQGSNADRGFSGCTSQESPSDLAVWP